MKDLIDNLLNLGQRRLIILGGVAGALMLTLLLGLSAISSPDMAALYKGLSPASATSVEAALGGAGFDARMSEDGTSVSVPRTDVARARMVLAELGLPIEGEPGWELFDDASGLAMNSFMQRINRLRAMEGELARSIQTLEGLQSARVHLVLPEREAFSREKPTPRASVIARAVSGRAITRKQAMAIRNLVASAVADLELGRVTVLSADGEVILAEDSAGGSQVTLQSSKAAIESRLAQEVKNLLTARVGAGNARVRVNVDLTSAREVIVQQSFDPDQQVVRSTENRNEQQAGSDAGGNVGVENNIPAALGAAPGGGATSNQSKTNESVRYEIGSTRRETIREAGEIRKVSVAVLVNGIYAVEDSDVVYSERGAQEIERLAELIKTAVGFDAARGDNISVDSLRFMDYSMEVGSPQTQTMTQRISESIVPILRGVLALAIIAMVLVLGVRPALRTLREQTPLELENPEVEGAAALGLVDGTEATTLPQDGGGALALQTATDASSKDHVHAADITSIFSPSDDSSSHEYIEALGVSGNLIKARVEAIQSFAEDKPEDVLRVMRSWLAKEADA